MTPAAVLFDCDGVIVDSEQIGLDLLRDSLARHGLCLAADAMHRLFLGGTIHTVADQARAMGAALPESWVDDHYAHLYARLAEGTPLVPGVAAVIDALDAAGIAYAVGSNGTTEKMRTTLTQHPEVWRRVKDQLYSGQELGCPKPDPGLYLHAARALGADPAACVVIDDSPSGCQAGLGAGIRTLGFAAAGNGDALADLGAEVFCAMSDLPGLIGL